MGGVKLTESVKTLLEEQTVRYQENVAQVASYLVSRGITEEAAITHRLGYVGTGDHGSDHEYANRLSIPYITPYGGVVDLRYRAVSPDVSPKYLSRSGAKTRLYNVGDLLKESPILYVTEGELDCIIASSIVGLPTVGVPGANAWMPHFKLLMQDYERIIVLCDGDEAGRAFGRTVCKEVDGSVAVSMPNGMDVTDVYLSGGPEALLKLVEL